jgi:hypothetical protein
MAAPVNAPRTDDFCCVLTDAAVRAFESHLNELDALKHVKPRLNALEPTGKCPGDFQLDEQLAWLEAFTYHTP